MRKKILIFLMLLFCGIGWSQVLEEQDDRAQQSVLSDCVSFEYKKFKIHYNEGGNPLDSEAAPDLDDKVVIGRRIDYKAKGSSSATWSWMLGAAAADPNPPTNPWSLGAVTKGNEDPPVASVFTNKGEAFIPDTDLPMANSDFGLTRGQVWVTNDDVAPLADGEPIEVFFDKDDQNTHDPAVPNWFYYWSQEVTGILGQTGMRFFTLVNDLAVLNPNPTPIDMTLTYREDGVYHWNEPVPGGPAVTNTWGSTSAGSDWFNFSEMITVPNSGNVCLPLGFRKVMSGYGALDFSINIGQGCGYKMQSNTYNINTGAIINADVVYWGIEGFVATIYHEMEHYKLREELWPNGYDTMDDCDKDGFPDSWEMTDPIAMAYGFVAGTTDEYNPGYDAGDLAASGASTWYQEVKCRNKEDSENTTFANGSDWSFDFTNIYQGKNWN